MHSRREKKSSVLHTSDAAVGLNLCSLPKAAILGGQLCSVQHFSLTSMVIGLLLIQKLKQEGVNQRNCLNVIRHLTVMPSESLRMEKTPKIPKSNPSPPPPYPLPTSLSATSPWFWNTPWGWRPLHLPGQLCHCITTPSERKCFLLSNLNLPGAT